MVKELEGLDECRKAKIQVRIMLKIPNWIIPVYENMHVFCFRKITSNHDRLALERNRCQEESDGRELMTKGKIALVQIYPLKKNHPKQLQTHNMPTDDVENTNGTKKGRYLRLT